METSFDKTRSARSRFAMTMRQAVAIAVLMIGSALGTTAMLAVEHVDNPAFHIF